MSCNRKKLVAELSHGINSPLTAIRNALYLVGCRTRAVEIHHYLQIADFEAVNIETLLRYARQEAESRFHNMRSRFKAA